MRLLRTAVLSLFALALLRCSLPAETPAERRQAYLDLTNDCVLMDLSAHPDDEDGSTLAYYRMKYGVKTYSVLFTRGEGGQNEKGPELYEELGVLRSNETEEAGKILGTEVYFLNFLDFGFSKTATEAFQKWGGQMEALRRLVFIIRTLKPDVLFTNHNTIDGHGHHQAVAITAIAAFDAAGDSTVFPEQLKEPGASLWHPKKLFFRVFGKGEPTADVSNGIQEINPARGVAYIEIAAEALKMHRTQGLDRINFRGFTARFKSLYKLMRSNSLYESDSTSFFSGINLWGDPVLASLVPLRTSLSLLHEGMSRDSVLNLASKLLGQIDSLALKNTTAPLATRMLDHWREELDHIVGISCGLQASLQLADTVVVPKQRVTATIGLNAELCELSSVHYVFRYPEGWSVEESPEAAPGHDGHAIRKEFTLSVADKPAFTIPKAKTQYRSLGLRQDVATDVSFQLDGRPVSFRVKARFDVAPPQILTVDPSVARVTPDRSTRGAEFVYTVKNYLPHKTAGRVHVDGPPGWMADPAVFTIASEDSMASGSIFVRPPANVTPGEYLLHFKTDVATCDVTAQVFDATVAGGLKVGIIKSYDTTLETAVGELGLTYTLLDDKEIEHGMLSNYTTILVDIRAYLVRDALKKFNNRLLDYVRTGGNLVVMYQRDQEWKPEYAPFPLSITRRRVTVEEAPVTVLVPDHPLLTRPNKITPRDWSGWKQERGLYFPGEVATQYTQLLSCNDPDEPPLTTGYLVADFGKGSYIYTSYVWYRQLKEANPGAFRCFANMLSYPVFRK